MTGRGLVLAAVLVLAASAAPAASSYVLTGSAEALWLVRIDEASGTFDAAVRLLGKNWRPAALEIVGQPAATMAMGTRLGVLFEGGQYRLFPSGRGESSTPGPDLPGRPLAAFGATDAVRPYALVLAAVDQAPATQADGQSATAGATQVATAPHGGATAPATSAATGANMSTATAPGEAATATNAAPPTRLPAVTTLPSAGPTLAIFRTEDGQWRRLATLPPLEAAQATRYFVAALGEEVFVLATGAPAGNQMLRYGDGQWQPVPLKEGLESRATLAMLVVNGRLVVAQAVARQDRLAVEVVTLDESATPLGRQLVTRAAKALDWPADQPPHAAQLGDQLALLWEQGGQLLLATASPATGDLLSAPQPQEDVWHSQMEAVGKIIDYFLLAVLAVAFVPLLMLRRQRPAKPFELPAHVRPAGLLRRVIAIALDFLPLAMLGQLIFQPPVPEADASWNRMLDAYMEVANERTAYTIIFTFAAWMLYGTAAEYLRGATLGKWMLGLRVVGPDAAQPTPRQAILRNMMKVFELLSLLGLVLTVMVMLFTRYRQRLGDLLARTAVVMAASLVQPPGQADRQDQGPYEVGPDLKPPREIGHKDQPPDDSNDSQDSPW